MRYLIKTGGKVETSAAETHTPQAGIHKETALGGVGRHQYFQMRTVDACIACHDFPLHRFRNAVLCCRVGKGDIEVGPVKHGFPHVHHTTFPCHTFHIGRQALHATVNGTVGNQRLGVQTGIGQTEGLDVGLRPQQRFQGYTELQAGGIDQRIALLVDCCKTIGLEVEHGGDTYVLHAHLHAQRLGHLFSHKIHCPPLYGGQIDEDAEKAHQKHRYQHEGTEELEESAGGDAHRILLGSVGIIYTQAKIASKNARKFSKCKEEKRVKRRRLQNQRYGISASVPTGLPGCLNLQALRRYAGRRTVQGNRLLHQRSRHGAAFRPPCR